MNKVILVLLSLSCGVAFATIDRPDVSSFYGTGYAGGGWFSYDVRFASDKEGGVPFDKIGKFLLSPQYDAPIRKIVMRAKSKAATPTRHLRVWPFVGGAEAGTNVYNCAAREVAEMNTYEFFSFDFRTDELVDAFRVGLDGPGSDAWRLDFLAVLFGEETADEPAFLRELLPALPPPANLRLDDFSSTGVCFVADEVADAAGYRFEVDRLEGCPRTEDVECFANAPAVTAEDWTIVSENAKFDAYTSAQYVDSESDEERKALKIESAGKTNDLVWVEVLSREMPTPVCEVSYMQKVSSAGQSDRIAVYGRSSVQSDDWMLIGTTNSPVDTAKTFVTNVVSTEANIRQVKFRFEAEANKFSTCALDTLRVVSAGNETRELVETPATNAEARCELTDLETGRYVCRVRAFGGEHYRDSPWSEYLPVDLTWADIVVAAPEGVALDASGEKLTVSWRQSVGAEHYLVTVVSVDDPDVAVARNQKATGTSLTVEVPRVGEYVATVTAVSPGGKSQAMSGTATGTVTLGSLGAVTIKVQDEHSIVATWKKIPLAEGYRAVLAKLGETEDAWKEVESVTVTEGTVTFCGLDPSGRYQVVVTPQPSEGDTSSSATIDLSAVRFRKTGAIPLSALKGGAYAEDFSVLTNVTKDADARMAPLDYWQFNKDSKEAEDLLYTDGATRTAGGVYAFGGGNACLGTLATGSFGCSVGLAFRNDSETSVAFPNLTFDTIQRNFRTNKATYVLEWLITDDATSIAADGSWQELKIPETAPYVEDAPAGQTEWRQNVRIASEEVSDRIPAGGVLILRWRHAEVASGPMMAIDNVCVEFPDTRSGCLMIVR